VEVDGTEVMGVPEWVYGVPECGEARNFAVVTTWPAWR
jgi:hypothetical protein